MTRIQHSVVGLISVVTLCVGLGMQETVPPAGEALVTAAIAFQGTLTPEQSKVKKNIMS